MSADYKKAIDALYIDLNKIEAKGLEIKKTINMLSSLIGQEAPFSDLDSDFSLTQSSTLKPDQFFGKSVGTAVKEYFNIFKKASTAEEVLDALKKGGFEFPDNWKESNFLKNLAIYLSRNTTDFVYIKNTNSYGLLDFYPEKKKDREKRAAAIKSAKNGAAETLEEVVEEEIVEPTGEEEKSEQ
jgi:hypothetical protein